MKFPFWHKSFTEKSVFSTKEIYILFSIITRMLIRKICFYGSFQIYFLKNLYKFQKLWNVFRYDIRKKEFFLTKLCMISYTDYGDHKILLKHEKID